MPELFLFVGCLNREAPYFQGARGKGIAVYVVDEDALAFEKHSETDDVDNPTFLSVDGRSGCLYANSEVFGWREGVVSAYRVDPRNSALTYLNKQPTLGSITAYNSITGDGRFLLVANYAMGNGGPDCSLAVLPIKPDGALGSAVASASHIGSGPDRERQERSHAHCVLESPDRSFALVADLGLDKILIYRLGPDGTLTRHAEVSLPPGCGPRHMEFHPDGDVLFLSGELDSSVHALAWANGKLTLAVSVKTVAADRAVPNHSADLHVSPDGRFVYVSNRGHDSIAVLEFDKKNRTLSPLAHTPSGGITPRNFAITPSGRHLFVANQNSDVVVAFERDETTGLLSDTGKRIEIGSPVCVKFASFSA